MQIAAMAMPLIMLTFSGLLQIREPRDGAVDNRQPKNRKRIAGTKAFCQNGRDITGCFLLFTQSTPARSPLRQIS
jgi:hypothetical protein